MVMTALNGLTRPWDSFIQMMCTKNESMKFDVVWVDCIQDETRVENREAPLKEDDQALATHNKRRRSQPNFRKGNKREYQPPRKIQKTRESLPDRDHSGFQCFHCDKFVLFL